MVGRSLIPGREAKIPHAKQCSQKDYFFKKKNFWTIISRPGFSTVFQHKWSGSVHIQNIMALQNKQPCISHAHHGLQSFQVCLHMHSHHKPIKKARQELPKKLVFLLLFLLYKKLLSKKLVLSGNKQFSPRCVVNRGNRAKVWPWLLSTSPEHSAARGLQICTLWSQDKKHLLLANVIGL